LCVRVGGWGACSRMKPFLIDNVAIADFLFWNSVVFYVFLQNHLTINGCFNLLFDVLVLSAFFAIEERPDKLGLCLLDEFFIGLFGCQVFRGPHVIISTLSFAWWWDLKFIINLYERFIALLVSITSKCNLSIAALMLLMLIRCPERLVIYLSKCENLVSWYLLILGSAAPALPGKNIFVLS